MVSPFNGARKVRLILEKKTLILIYFLVFRPIKMCFVVTNEILKVHMIFFHVLR